MPALAAPRGTWLLWRRPSPAPPRPPPPDPWRRGGAVLTTGERSQRIGLLRTLLREGLLTSKQSCPVPCSFSKTKDVSRGTTSPPSPSRTSSQVCLAPSQQLLVTYLYGKAGMHGGGLKEISRKKWFWLRATTFQCVSIFIPAPSCCTRESRLAPGSASATSGASIAAPCTSQGCPLPGPPSPPGRPTAQRSPWGHRPPPSPPRGHGPSAGEGLDGKRLRKFGTKHTRSIRFVPNFFCIQYSSTISAAKNPCVSLPKIEKKTRISILKCVCTLGNLYYRQHYACFFECIGLGQLKGQKSMGVWGSDS